jgi:hypothetical protein
MSRPIAALLGLAILVAVVAVLIFVPRQFAFTDSEPLAVTPAPTARTACEAAFHAELFADYDATDRESHPLTAEQLEPVFGACTRAELVRADRYFQYTLGGPMTALRAQRIFGGPIERQTGQMDAWCAHEALATTMACSDAPRDCDMSDGAITDVSSEPAGVRQAGWYDIWRTDDGCVIRIDVVAGVPQHCGLVGARALSLGDPPGSRMRDGGDALTYIRDPMNLLGDAATARAFDADADLPENAIDTGFRHRTGQQLWLAEDDLSAIYLVTPRSIERWPLDAQPPSCG